MGYPIVNPNATVPNPAANPSGSAPDLPGVFAPANPASWIYDFNPASKMARATFAGEVTGGGGPLEPRQFRWAYVDSNQSYQIEPGIDAVYLINYSPGTVIRLTVPDGLPSASIFVVVVMQPGAIFELAGRIFFPTPPHGLGVNPGGLFTVTAPQPSSTMLFFDLLVGDGFTMVINNGYPFTGVPVAYLPNPFTVAGMTQGVASASMTAPLGASS